MTPQYQDQAQSLREQFNNVETKIICISGGKGGVGKSVFSVNLSTEIAKTGKSVLLFDSDAGFANASILLGKNVNFTLSDYIDGKANIEKCVQKTKYGVNVISTGFDFKDWKIFQNNFTNKMADEFLKVASKHDYLIVDIGAGYSEKLNSFYISADKILLVTIPEPTAIVNAYTLIKALSMIGVNAELNIILNMIRDKNEIEPVKEVLNRTVSKFLNKKIEKFYDVYYEKLVHDSIKRQIPIVEFKENIRFSKIIKEISMDIMEEDYQQKEPFINKFKKLFGLGV